MAERQELAEAFGKNLDPLAEFVEPFETTDIDPFKLAKAEVVNSRDLTDRTEREYDRVFRQWCDHMQRQKRHPACPNEEHVKAFVEYEREEKGNSPGTIISKIERLNVAYEYWQDDPAFPHPQDYNPFRLTKEKANLTKETPKEPPRIEIETLRDILDDVTNIRDRAIIVLQFKLGLRATELCNLRISEINLTNSEIRRHYDDLGSNPMIENRPNAVYIPHDREGNKSKRPRVLPLDDEARRVLLRYLLVRPTNGTPEVFLSKTRHKKLNKQAVNDVWKDVFHPEYGETEEHRAVTSHFGRHRFTTYWRVGEDLNKEIIKYMRGDKFGSTNSDDRAAINDYIHTYYEDVEPIYRERIFKLNV